MGLHSQCMMQICSAMVPTTPEVPKHVVAGYERRRLSVHCFDSRVLWLGQSTVRYRTRCGLRTGHTCLTAGEFPSAHNDCIAPRL